MAAGVLAVVAVGVYLPALNGGFVWDDEDYITTNPHVRQLDAGTVAWAFTRSHAANWHPLTWLSHALDVQLFGYEPRGHHAVNVVLHAFNAGLLLIVLFRLTGHVRRSAVVGALFALHPLHVESVAWIAERKDVLSALFLMLTLLAYVAYARQPRPSSYALVVLALAAGLASKQMLVTVPLVLLLLDYWPLRRFGRRAILEKLPLLLLSAAASAATLWAQSMHGALAPIGSGLAVRVQNATIVYIRYLLATIWPVERAPYYPFPGLEADPYPVWAFPLAALVLVGITVWVVLRVRTRPYLVVGWLFYLGTLVPVIGIVQVGRQAMADRYTYIPLIGIFVAVVWWIGDWIGERASRIGASAAKWVGAAILLTFAVLTWSQIRIWRDSESLWTRAVVSAPQAAVVHFNLANALIERGAVEQAIAEYRLAGELDDDGPASAHARIGSILREQGRTDQALVELREAVRLRPESAEFRDRLANALFDLGRTGEAEEHYVQALELSRSPAGSARIHRNYALMLLARNRTGEALEHCRLAVELDPTPDNFEALAFSEVRDGRPQDALTTLRRGLQRHPGHPRLLQRLGQLGADASP